MHLVLVNHISSVRSSACFRHLNGLKGRLLKSTHHTKLLFAQKSLNGKCVLLFFTCWVDFKPNSLNSTIYLISLLIHSTFHILFYFTTGIQPPPRLSTILRKTLSIWIESLLKIFNGTPKPKTNWKRSPWIVFQKAISLRNFLTARRCEYEILSD